jgi:hypothetical protein
MENNNQMTTTLHSFRTYENIDSRMNGKHIISQPSLGLGIRPSPATLRERREKEGLQVVSSKKQILPSLCVLSSSRYNGKPNFDVVNTTSSEADQTPPPCTRETPL